MGNRASHRAGKVVLPDGSICELHEPLTVAELMLEHPHQVVVELSCRQSQPEKLTPLPADKKLELDKLYLMMPLKSGKLPCFTSQDAHQILLSVNGVLRSQSFLPSCTRSLAVFARICGGASRGKAASKFVVARKDLEAEEEEGEGVGGGRKEYLARKVSGRGWRPSLDTIEERKDLSLVLLAGKAVRRIEYKGLVWG